MRLPQRKKPGDPVLASDWNLLLEAVEARTPRPGAGLELIASSGGFAYSRPSPLSAPHAGLPPFSVIGIEKDGGAFKVTVKEGWVIERKPKTGDHPAVKFHMPKAGGTALGSIPRPQIGMSIGDTLWCKFTTGTTGEITGTPEILADSLDHDGVHYYPEDPDASGGEGEYWVKLLKLEDDGGSPRVKVFQQSDIEHWAQLWTGGNSGSGARVFKEHDEEQNVWRFRTLRGLGGITVTEKDQEIEIGGGGHGRHANIRVIQWRLYPVTVDGTEGHLTLDPLDNWIIYIRFGRYVGYSQQFDHGDLEAAIPPWNEDSPFYDPALYPDEEDPAGDDPVDMFNLTELEYASS